ncbi:UDP-N-acetylglucosamine-peptide N-acetylglucosaminyltransferase [Pseudophaeobacter sp.]|uniref:O-linked N-acetylglucosamine transferase, SPINDLY family protein n=1 Tax=Pseudophaeobacter sp. TaxID=1971739 RepID=UPI003299126A
MAILENDFAKARQVLDQAVSFYPQDPAIRRMSGDIHLQQNSYDNALMEYMECVGINPLDTKALCSIGKLLLLLGKENDAKGFFLAAHRTKPMEVFSAYSLIHTCMAVSDWSIFDTMPKLLQLGDKAPLDVKPFALLAVTDNPGLHKTRVSARAKTIAKNVKENKKFNHTTVKGRKIRLGFFSSDFFNHATMLLLGRFFEMVDRERFEVCLYDYGTQRENEIQQRVKETSDIYHNVLDLNDGELAELARQDGIDVAIDMKGYTKDARLGVFVSRVAPVQVSYLGYPGTTGMSNMDYFVADEVTVPQAMRRHFSEKILYMPHCYQPNDNSRPLPEFSSDRAAHGLPEDKFVFCSMNNPNKVTPQEFNVWMKLLHEVPDSVLWLLAPTEFLQQNLLHEAEARGIDAERLVFAGRVRMSEHMERMQHADLFLDAFNCNAHTTASEAVWSGLPLVTKAGEQFAARVAASILTAIECEDLVTTTVEEYHDLALKLATDPEALAEVKQRLKDNLHTTPLYDSEAYVRDFENLMEKAILRYEEGLRPKHMSLN